MSILHALPLPSYPLLTSYLPPPFLLSHLPSPTSSAVNLVGMQAYPRSDGKGAMFRIELPITPIPGMYIHSCCRPYYDIPLTPFSPPSPHSFPTPLTPFFSPPFLSLYPTPFNPYPPLLFPFLFQA